MPFEKCPICGETNFEEDVVQERSFECGFSSLKDRRTSQCQTPKEDRNPSTSRPAATNDEAARYRLALLDAAQVADVLAADMSTAGQDARFVDRCRELARQIRAFAGHTSDAGSFADRHARHKAPEKGLIAFIQRAKPW